MPSHFAFCQEGTVKAEKPIPEFQFPGQFQCTFPAVAISIVIVVYSLSLYNKFKFTTQYASHLSKFVLCSLCMEIAGSSTETTAAWFLETSGGNRTLNIYLTTNVWSKYPN
jgi:hypothetical protein